MKLLSSKKIDIILAFFSTMCFLLLIYFRVGFIFETNDDVYINQFLSGTMTGKPDAHVVYINYGLARIFTLLYTLTAKVPWYSIFLILLLGISYSTITYSLLSRAQSIAAKFETMVLLFGGIYLTAIYTTSQIQYTAIAAWVAIAGFCFLCKGGKDKKTYIFFFALELLAFLLRKEAMFMIQPFGFSVYGSLVLLERELDKKQKWIEVVKLISVMLVCYLVGFVFNRIGYHSEEWDEYFAYNEARTVIYDYYYIPEYSEVADILEKYDLSKTDYMGFAHYLNVGSNFNSECAKEIAEYVEANYDKEDFGQKIIRAVESLIPDDPMINTAGLFAMIAIVLITVLLVRQYRLLLPILAVICCHILIWGYLSYRGRMLERVLYPLISGELVFLLIIYSIAKSRRKTIERKNTYKVFIHLCLSVALCYLCFSSYGVGKVQYKYTINKCKGTEILQDSYAEVMDYCRERSENAYIFDSLTFCFCTTSVFDTACYGPANHIPAGGWFGYSPLYAKHAEEYLGDFSQKFYLVYYAGTADGQPVEELDVDDKSGWEHGPYYFSLVSGRTRRLSDTIAVKAGFVYSVVEY